MVNKFFLSFYLNSSYLTYSVILVSGVHGQLIFDKEAKIYNGERIVSSKMVLEKTVESHEKNETGPLSHTMYKNQCKIG